MSFSVLSLSHLPYCQFTANLLQLGMVEAGPSTAREKREERNAYTRSQNSEICEVIHEIEDFSGEIHKDTKSQVAFSTSPRFCSFPKFSQTESFSFLSHNTQLSIRERYTPAHSSASYKLPVRPFSLDRVTTRQVLLTLPFWTRVRAARDQRAAGLGCVA